MKLDKGTAAGLLLAAGAAQFMLLMVISEALYKGYSVANNFISDLGVGTTAPIFNSSIVLMGMMIVAAAYLLAKAKKEIYMCALLAIVGIAAACVGIFPETTGLPHIAAASCAFMLGGVFGLLSYRIVKLPLGYVTGALGIVTLFAVVSYLFLHSDYGLGHGGLERMIAYPLIMVVLLVGSALIKSK
ncbi:MAG: DUF998 domain-containing protein [Candidatus Micrarchaeota archaeon]|nr:DUF998 domain-containing protein [Candidatus Micrarchaeota archaeon]